MKNKIEKKKFVLIKNLDSKKILVTEKSFTVDAEEIIDFKYHQATIYITENFKKLIKELDKSVENHRIYTNINLTKDEYCDYNVPFNKLITGDNVIIGIQNLKNPKFYKSHIYKSFKKQVLKNYKKQVETFSSLTGTSPEKFNSHKIKMNEILLMKQFNELMLNNDISEEDYYNLYNVHSKIIEESYPKVERKHIYGKK